jgi:hypothetical protein
VVNGVLFFGTVCRIFVASAIALFAAFLLNLPFVSRLDLLLYVNGFPQRDSDSETDLCIGIDKDDMGNLI